MISNAKTFLKKYQEPTLTNYTIMGNCSRCGECCSEFLPLDSKEIEEIEKYIRTHKVKIHNKEKNNFRCPFRNDEKKICEIYKVRPQICKVFKCDTKPEEAFKRRDELSLNKKSRSMSEVFYNDKSKLKIAKSLGLKVHRKGE